MGVLDTKWQQETFKASYLEKKTSDYFVHTEIKPDHNFSQAPSWIIGNQSVSVCYIVQSVVQLVCELLLKGSLLKLEAVFLLPNLLDSL